jgi:biotin-(acetyl-CoA carboxylase) ligase
MALRVGLAVMRALGDLEVAAGLKWPNDVVASDRRLGGIRCEARWSQRRVAWVAVGVGLDREGALLVETEQGVERIVGGSVAAA